MVFLVIGVLVVLGLGAFLALRGKATPAPAVVEVRPAPKTLGEVLLFGVVDRWGERLKKSLEEASR